MNKDKRAWETYKFITFVNVLVSFVCGALCISFIKNDFMYPMTLIVVGPIIMFLNWKAYSKIFLKEGIKP